MFESTQVLTQVTHACHGEGADRGPKWIAISKDGPTMRIRPNMIRSRSTAGECRRIMLAETARGVTAMMRNCPLLAMSQSR